MGPDYLLTPTAITDLFSTLWPSCGYAMVPFKPCLAGPWEVALLGLQVISSSSYEIVIHDNCCQL